MQVYGIKVRNFRGVAEMHWRIGSTVVALIGPGDAGKSTVLDAIEWALWPLRSLRVTDADFTNLKVDDDLVIEVTVGDVPGELLAEQAFGRHQRARCLDGTLHDEPAHDDDTPVLSVRLTVDASLECTWEVVGGERIQSKPISSYQRAALGVSRLGGDPDRHLRWGWGSTLAQLTEGQDQAAGVLAAVYRAARTGVTKEDFKALDDAVTVVRGRATEFGARLDPETIQPGIDPAALNPTAAALGLHSEGVPLNRAGLATRRLISLALQSHAVAGGAILLIDEVEHGLEPHRLRHLLRVLRDAVAAPGGPSQVFFTTHSPIAVVELSAEDLHVTRKDNDGSVEVRVVPEELQSVVRSHPEALLAPAVVVGEGKTEFGLLRGLDRFWRAEPGGAPLVHRGVSLAEGTGTDAPTKVRDLQGLGYETSLFVDGDVPLNPSADELVKSGVKVVQWGGGANTEWRLSQDLPLGTLVEALILIVETVETLVLNQLRGDIAGKLGRSQGDLPADLADWSAEVGEEVFREAVAQAMCAGGWIKRVDVAERIGMLLGSALAQMGDTDTSQKLAVLRAWVDER